MAQDGLWSCAFCGVECAPSEICWDLRGSLTVKQPAGQPAPAGAAAEPVGDSTVTAPAPEPGAEAQPWERGLGPSSLPSTWTLPADPPALRMVLGVPAEAWRGMGSVRRAEWKQAVR